MFLPKLFSKRSDGGLQSWQIEVEGNKFRTISGMVDGAMVTSEWTQCAGKNIGRANETTPEQQAAAEAQSKWQKKYDSGYRETAEALETVDLFEPMLANKYKDLVKRKKLAFPVYCQPKLDGVRCIGRPSGLWTRKGKPHTNLEHIRMELAPVFAKHPTLVIDGEAYCDKLNDDFNAIISLVRQMNPTPEERADAAAHIKYHIYDCYFADAPALPFSERMAKLGGILANSHDLGNLVLVETHKSETQEQLDEYYAKWLEAGYEGQMLRTDTPYEINKRTWALVKRKEFVDEEFELAAVEEGKGNRSGMAGKVLLTTGDRAGIRGGTKFMTEIWEKRNAMVGKYVTVRYQGKTPDGKLRFPVLVAVRDYE